MKRLKGKPKKKRNGSELLRGERDQRLPKYLLGQLRLHPVRSTLPEWLLVNFPQSHIRLALSLVSIIPRRQQRLWIQCNNTSSLPNYIPATPRKRPIRKAHNKCSNLNSARHRFLLRTMNRMRMRMQTRTLLRLSHPTTSNHTTGVVHYQTANPVFINTMLFDKRNFTTSCATTVSFSGSRFFLCMWGDQKNECSQAYE